MLTSALHKIVLFTVVFIGIIHITSAQIVLNIVTDQKPLQASDGDTISMCPDAVFHIWAEASYDPTDVVFADSVFNDTTTFFRWYWGDESVDEGVFMDSLAHSYPNGQGYYIRLFVRDKYGNEQWAIQPVRVSLRANFNGTRTSAGNTPLCIDKKNDEIDSVTLYGVHKNPKWQYLPPEEKWETEPFEINIGKPFTSTITHEMFPITDTLDNADTIQGICLLLEHSDMSDLKVMIACPYDTITLKDFGGDTLFLGEPIKTDTLSNLIGVPYRYCWSTKPDYGTMNASTTDTLISGIYAADEAIEGLIGCMLDNDWSIIVEDNDSTNNGYIWGWELDFDDQLYEPRWKYSNTYIYPTWLGDHMLTGTNSFGIAKASPQIVGSSRYRYVVVDTLWNCERDTFVYVNTSKPTFTTDKTTILLTESTLEQGLVQFTSTTAWAVDWFWKFGDKEEGSGDKTEHSYLEKGKYPVVLTATSEQGCVSLSDTILITVDWEPMMLGQIPNVFTPGNDDSRNDAFLLEQMQAVKTFDCWIYNRYGELVCHINNPDEGKNIGWDGSLLNNGNLNVSAGVYFYVIKATGYDETKADERGFLYLMR